MLLDSSMFQSDDWAGDHSGVRSRQVLRVLVDGEHRIHRACGEERSGNHQEEGAGREGAGLTGRGVTTAWEEGAVGMSRSQNAVRCDFEGVEDHQAFREELVVDRRREIQVGH